MNLIYKLYNLALAEQTMPTPWGRYHILWIVGVVAFSVVLCALIGKSEDRGFRVSILVLWGIMLVFETYKQVFFSISVSEGALVFDYDWCVFPFQLCSTPLYVLPFLGILRDGPARDFAASYTMSFALLGGLAVYAFPGSVFGKCIIGNVHTMLHHGIQIVTGIVTAARYGRRIGHSFFMKGVAVFTAMFTVAMLLNTVGREYLVSIGEISADTPFNMFMINPAFRIETPVLQDLVGRISPWAIVAIYFFGVPIAAAAVAWGCRAIYQSSTSGRKILSR